MFLARTAWPIIRRSATRPAIYTGNRFFRLSSRAFKSFENSQERISPEVAEELKALRELQDDNISKMVLPFHTFTEKWLNELDAERKKNPDLKDIYLPYPEPLSPEMSARYILTYQGILLLFIRSAKDLHRLLPSIQSREGHVRNIKEHIQVVPELTETEIDAAELFYFRLINKRVFLEELTFTDDKVAKLHKQYLKMDFSEEGDQSKEFKEFAENMGVSEEAAVNWFYIFSIWDEIPCVETPFFIPQVTKNLTFDKEILNKDFDGFISSWATQRSQNKTDKTQGKAGDKSGAKSPMSNMKPFSPEYMRFSFGIMLTGFLLVYLLLSDSASEHEISFQQFCGEFLRKNYVAKLHVINNRSAIIELNDNGKQILAGQAGALPGANYYFNIGLVESFERQLKNVQDEYKIPDSLRVPVVYSTEGSLAKVLINFLPTLLFLGAIYYMTKKANLGAGGPLSFGKSQAKKFNQEKDIKIRFKDVAGMSEAKQEVMEFVKFLQNPAKYEKLGAKIPRGAILSGPPGTGKTLIARATAGEAGVPFYSVSGSEFVEMFVGVGASRVRDLFKVARENAPSIVFVDEIDAIGKNRSKGNASGANDERESTLNQLLVEMDGFDSSNHVVVLAGTNRPDILDKALMRPGRFDRHIAIDNPELQGRIEIFNVHLKKIKLVENIDKNLAGRLAALTPGFSGADIANVCNEAALIAARYNAKAVTLRHFELAIERVIGGVEKRSKLLDPQEKRIVAYHEAGHAVCGWFLKHAYPLLKVSIIPRGQGALGYAQYLPPDQHLMSALQLYDRMVMTLGGRVSEELKFASVTSGAHDDFKKVTQIAQSMVMRFGMSDKVGMVNYADTQSQDNLTKPFSDETNNVIDQEVRRIVQECYDKCRELLTEKKDAVEQVAQELLRKEFITREDMIRLLGKRPFPENNDAFDKYLDGKPAYQNEKPPEEKKDDEL